MDIVIKIASIFVLIIYFIFYFYSIFKLALVEAVIIASFYPIISASVGQENAKALITLSLLLIILLIYYQVKYKVIFFIDKSLKNNTIVGLLILLFFFYFIINAIFSPAFGSSYFKTKLIFFSLNLLFPTLLILFIDLPNNIKVLIRFFIVESLLVSFILFLRVLEFGILDILSHSWFPRLSVGDANIIWLGRLFAIGLIFSWFFIKKGFIKLIFIIYFLFLMFLTGSKAVLAFPIVSIVFFELVRIKSRIKIKRLISITLTIIILGIITTQVVNKINPLALERRFSFKSGTIFKRHVMIDKVMADVKVTKKYIFGHGVATIGKAIKGKYVRAYPHNITIELLYELGITGLFLYYTPYILLFIEFLKNREFRDNNIYTSVFLLTFLFLLFAQTSGDLQSNSMNFLFLGYTFYLNSSMFKYRKL